MSWAYLDDQVAFHRKTLAAGNEAFGAWIRMIAHACAYDTKGVIERPVALSITTKKQVGRLLDVVLLEVHQAGPHYVIHDFNQWQAPRLRTTPAELSAKRSEAGRKGAHRRWQPGSLEPPHGMANGHALPMSNDGKLPWQNVAPSPSPDPREEIAILPSVPTLHGRGGLGGGGRPADLPIHEPESETRVATSAPHRRRGPASTAGVEAERAKQNAAAEDWTRKNGGGAR